MTLPADEAFAAFHFVVNEGVIQVQFHDRKALFILLVQVERLSGEELKANVMAEQFMGLKKRMDLLEVIVPEVALPHQVDTSDVVVGKGEQLITVEDGVRVVMHVEVFDGEVVEFPEAVVS
jgi:hypothetical protein